VADRRLLLGGLVVLLILAVGIALLAWPGGGEEAAETEKKILIAATLKSGLSTFDVIEQDPGILEGLPINITVKRFTVPPNVVDAILQGDAQLTVVPVELAAKIIIQSEGQAYIVALDNELNQAILVRPDSGIENPQDLKGRKVAAVVGSGTYALFTVFMEELYNLSVGEDGSDIVIVNVGNPAAVLDAVARGDADAAVIWEPLVSLGEYKYNLEVLVTFKDLWREYAGDKPAPMLVWVAREEVVADEDALTAVLEAHRRAAVKWNENPDGWTVDMLARLYNLPDEVAITVWERNQMYTGECINNDLVDSMLILWDMAVKAGYIDRAPSPSSIITCESLGQP